MKLCSITSGSSGNCILTGSDNTSILIDAGISGKKIEEGLNSIDMTTRDIDGILVTHEHSDHIQGLGVLARRYGMHIYATEGTIAALRQMPQLGKLQDVIFRPVYPDKTFMIEDLSIRPFAISHDAAQPVGYRIENGEKSVAVATDLGFYDDYIVENLSGLDAILLEANHDVHMLQVGGYPYYLKQRILGECGHLSNETAGRLLCEVLHDKMKAIFLGHLSQENNYAELAFETVCSEVTMGENPYHARDFHIQIARRNQVSEMILV